MGNRGEDVDLAHDHPREVDLARRGMQADEQHAPPAAHADDRRRRRVSRAAGLDHHVEPDAIAEFTQQRREVMAGGVDCLVGAQGGRGGQPLGVDVDRDNASVDRSP